MSTKPEIDRNTRREHLDGSDCQPKVVGEQPVAVDADPRQGVHQPIKPESGDPSHLAHAQRPAPKKPPPDTTGLRQNLSGVDSLPERSSREKDDNYRAVLFPLNRRWRVATCKDQIQWLLQQRDNTRWRPRAYCRTREGLLRCVREYAGPIDPAALASLMALPERHP